MPHNGNGSPGFVEIGGPTEPIEQNHVKRRQRLVPGLGDESRIDNLQRCLRSDPGLQKTGENPAGHRTVHGGASARTHSVAQNGSLPSETI